MNTNTTREVDLTMVNQTESLWTSKTTSYVNEAMVKFNSMNIKIAKNGTVNINSMTSRKYIRLDDIIDAVRPALADCGCYVEQHLAGDSVITRIVHVSGEYIASKLHYQAMDGSSNALQKMGGGLTYLRRYALSSICNIVADEDSDAEGVDNITKKGIKTPTYSAPAPSQSIAQPTDNKEWLNLKDKAGNFTEKGNNAILYIRGGGAVEDITKKYKVSKADMESLRKTEADTREEMLYEQHHEQMNASDNGELPY